MPQVEASRRGVGWIDIHADPRRFLLDEPGCQESKQPRADSATAALRNDIDPLQFSSARVSAREVSSNKAKEGIGFRCYVYDAGSQRVLRMQFPILLRFPLFGPDSRYGGNVLSLNLSIMHAGHGRTISSPRVAERARSQQ